MGRPAITPREKELLRICLVAGQFPPTIGGEERHAELLGKALVACGHEVCVLTQPVPGAPRRETVQGLRVERAIRSLRHKPLVGPTYAASVALFLLRRRRAFDIVQTTYLYWETVVAALLKRLLKPRLVVRIVVPGPGGDIDRFRALRLWPFPDRWRRRALERLTALVLRRADAFITLTPCGREELIGLGISPARCFVVPNGIECSRFASVPRSPWHEGTPRLICLARLVRQKGLDVLLRALPVLQAAVGPVALTLLGEGPEQSRLAALAVELGVADAVCFAGTVGDVRPHLAAADVFVLPSRFEGLPLALLEAMGAGLPVVATAVSGNTDAVRDGVDGLLVPPEDPAALAAAVACVLRDPDLATRLATTARLRVASHFGVETMVDRTLQVYRETLHTGMRCVHT
ncbi:MAG: glycosyltransferase family 4 protein [candidate division NC10 bacterium]|nr:glycosyltransferase family 4 protein [candidate division NC10 bacterium]